MDILFLIVILILAVAIVALAGESPFVKKCAHVGGIGWLIWLVVQIGKYLFAH